MSGIQWIHITYFIYIKNTKNHSSSKSISVLIKDLNTYNILIRVYTYKYNTLIKMQIFNGSN